jgi:hypothetical protein
MEGKGMYAAVCRNHSEVARLVLISTDCVETAKDLFCTYLDNVPSLDVTFYEVPETLASVLQPVSGLLQEFWLDVDNKFNQPPTIIGPA